MASKSLGTLTLDLIAKIGGFIGPMDKAARESKKRMGEIQQSVQEAGNTIRNVAAAVTAGAFTLWVKSSIDAAAAIEGMANVANASTTEFQRMAAGARAHGIEQEQLADILKDVNDRIGDFVQTGGGPMADFFENIAPKVGVTIESFRKLSGPQALGLFVESLEKAGLSQQEMTFYMEAMASDSTKLLPLLRDNGRELNALADEAQNLGLVLSEDTIAKSKEFHDSLDLLGRVTNSVGQQISAELLPELIELTDTLRDPETAAAAADLAKGVTTGFTTIINGAREMVGIVKWAADSAAAAMNGSALDDIVRVEEELDGANQRLTLLADELERTRILRINPFQSTPDLEAEYNGVLNRIRQLEKARDDFYSKSPVVAALPVTVPSEPAPASDTPWVSKAEQEAAKKAGEQAAKDAAKAAEDAIKARERAAEAIRSEVSAIEQEAATLGMSAEQERLYRLELKGATADQLAQAKAALDSVAAFEAQTEAKKKAAEEQARINEEAQGIADSLLSEEEQILQSYERRRQIILDNTKFTGEAQAELLRKLEEQKSEELLEINGGYWERYLEAAEESLLSFDELAGSVVENFSEQFGDAFESMIFDAESLGEAVSGMADSMARSVVNALGQMAAQWLAYQLVQMMVGSSAQSSSALAVVANAQASAALAALNAYASTAAIPITGPAAAPAAAAAAAAATTPMVATVAAAATAGLTGMAHEGIDSVPQTGTWLLERGERVTTAETSAKLDRTLSDIQASRAASGDGRPLQITNHFPNVSNAREAREAGSAAARRLARAVHGAGRYT